MSSFTTPLITKINHGKKKQFEVFVPFKYHVNKIPSDETIEVHIGFESDLASIPRIFWPILSPIDIYAKAAVLHDWLYYRGIYSRKKSDQIFNEAMAVLGTPTWKRVTIYAFVRAFGWWRWYNARRED